jgi:hypothetical protein
VVVGAQRGIAVDVDVEGFVEWNSSGPDPAAVFDDEVGARLSPATGP